MSTCIDFFRTHHPAERNTLFQQFFRLLGRLDDDISLLPIGYFLQNQACHTVFRRKHRKITHPLTPFFSCIVPCLPEGCNGQKVRFPSKTSGKTLCFTGVFPFVSDRFPRNTTHAILCHLCILYTFTAQFTHLHSVYLPNICKKFVFFLFYT